MRFLLRYFKGKKTSAPTTVDYKKSYSQQGEDLILDFIFDWLKIDNPTYLDIGTNHPKHLNNTYLFYLAGSHGVCVEPDPLLAKLIKAERPKDKIINAGVGAGKRSSAQFYLMSMNTLNTFSKKEARMYIGYHGARIEEVIEIPLLSINDVIRNNFRSKPNLISIDTEGMDYQILKSLNFKKYRPEVFCIETIRYTGPHSLKRDEKILRLMKAKSYFLYAETLINSIFVDHLAWKKRKLQDLEGF